MIAVDLLAFVQTLLLQHDTPLARAEPKTLRYRLLHVAAKLTRGQRGSGCASTGIWPWAIDLAAALAWLIALPTPRRLTFEPDTTSGGSDRQNNMPGTSYARQPEQPQQRSSREFQDQPTAP